MTQHASVLLLAERTAFGQSCLATGGLAQHLRAASAEDDGLRVAEDRGDGEAAGALDVHEEGVRALHQALQLVLACLRHFRGEQQILNHLDV